MKLFSRTKRDMTSNLTSRIPLLPSSLHLRSGCSFLVHIVPTEDSLLAHPNNERSCVREESALIWKGSHVIPQQSNTHMLLPAGFLQLLFVCVYPVTSLCPHGWKHLSWCGAGAASHKCLMDTGCCVGPKRIRELLEPKCWLSTDVIMVS